MVWLQIFWLPVISSKNNRDFDSSGYHLLRIRHFVVIPQIKTFLQTQNLKKHEISPSSKDGLETPISIIFCNNCQWLVSDNFSLLTMHLYNLLSWLVVGTSILQFVRPSVSSSVNWSNCGSITPFIGPSIWLVGWSDTLLFM